MTKMLNVFTTNVFGWFPHGNIHCNWVGMAGNSNHQKVDTAVGYSGKQSTHFAAYTLINCQISKHFQNSLGHIPPQQAWANYRHLVQENLSSVEPFLDNIIATHTGIKTFKLYQHVCKYLQKCLQCSFSCFPCIWQHVKALPSHSLL